MAPLRILGIQHFDRGSFGRLERRILDLGHELLVVRTDLGETLPPAAGFDAVLVGGSPLAAYDIESHPFLVREAEWLSSALTAGMPCLGICFGAQLLAQVLGGRVYPSSHREIGVVEVRLTPAGRDDSVFRRFPATFPAAQWHGDTFDLPAGAELLVEGDTCRNQSFRLGAAVGVQFHPEVDAGAVASWAEASPEDLDDVGLSPEAVVAEVRAHDAAMALLAARLVENFLGTETGETGGP